MGMGSGGEKVSEWKESGLGSGLERDVELELGLAHVAMGWERESTMRWSHR